MVTLIQNKPSGIQTFFFDDDYYTDFKTIHLRSAGILEAGLINENVRLQFSVSRYEVLTKNLERWKAQVKELRKAGWNAEGCLLITFDGYDDDPREVFQINEVRKYVKCLYKKCPELFFYLTADATLIIMMCLITMGISIILPDGRIHSTLPLTTPENQQIREEVFRLRDEYIENLNNQGKNGVVDSSISI